VRERNQVGKLVEGERADGTDFLVSLVRAKKGATEKTTPDWGHAVSVLAKASGDVESGRVLARLCTERPADPEVFQSIVYWVKCAMYAFERYPGDVKNGVWEGADAVLQGFDSLTHPPYAEAAFTVWTAFAPDEAVPSITTYIDPAHPARRVALCRSLASVEAQELKKRFLRRLKTHPEAANAVSEALQFVAADPDSDEYTKKCANTALNLLRGA
jgi:hypothetical protein